VWWAHSCNPSTLEAESRESGLHNHILTPKKTDRKEGKEGGKKGKRKEGEKGERKGFTFGLEAQLSRSDARLWDNPQHQRKIFFLMFYFFLF
jgi:hypothetical protein